jgi:hypothetical protein
VRPRLPRFALAATLYLGATFLVMNYVRKVAHLKGNWFASISNYILCFTYFKAVVNTLLSKLGFKEKAGFKATDKRGGPQQGSIMRLMNNLKRCAAAPALAPALSRPPRAAGGGSPRLARPAR